MAERQPVLLSVDDEQGVLNALKRSLRKVDVEVISTTSGEEALTFLEERTVDVILSDMRMPGVTGPELLKKAAELQPSASRIVLTGYADIEDTRSVINEAGVSAYLTKPWDDDELRRLVCEGIRVATLTRENHRLAELTQRQNEELKAFNETLEARIKRRTDELEATNGKLAETLEKLQANHQHMVGLVASIAALPNQETDNARLKVAIAQALGQAYALSDEQLAVLVEATRLHRLGYVGLPLQLRQLPREQQSEEQRQLFEKHPVYAHAALLSMESMAPVSEVLYAQHEAYDGSGFPEGSAGSSIPLEARLLAVARDYVDYQTGRINGERATAQQALSYLKSHKDSLFDPDVILKLPDVLESITEGDVGLKELQLGSHSLQPGMRLSRDLYSLEGVLLLASGTELTEAAIKTLVGLEERSEGELEIFVAENREGG